MEDDTITDDQTAEATSDTAETPDPEKNMDEIVVVGQRDTPVIAQPNVSISPTGDVCGTKPIFTAADGKIVGTGSFCAGLTGVAVEGGVAVETGISAVPAFKISAGAGASPTGNTYNYAAAEIQITEGVDVGGFRIAPTAGVEYSGGQVGPVFGVTGGLKF